MKKVILLLMFLWLVSSIFATVTTFPWTEDFEGTFLPTGWAKEIPDAANDITQNDAQNHTTGGTYSARFSSYNSSSDYNQYLFSDAIQVTSPYTQLTFWVRKYNTSSEELYWGFATSQSSSAVSTWNDISDKLSNSDWTEITIDLSGQVGNTIYIAWHYYGNYLYYVYLDDVNIDEPPSCPDPSDQVVSNITSTSADLSWTQLGSVSSWDIELGTTGFTPTGTPTQSGVTNPYTYTGLTANTTYDWYVRADCGSGQYSAWVGPNTFTTRCDANTTYPYTQDFATWPPNCWDLTGGSASWAQYSDSGVDCAEASFWSQTAGNTDIMTTITMDVSSLTTPVLSFDWSHLYSSSYPGDSLSVEVSDDNGSTWHQVWAKGGADLDSGDGAGNTEPGSFVSSGYLDLSSYGNSLLIRFFATSGYGPDLFVDNVVVQEAPSCLNPSAQTESNIGQTSVDLGWTENNSPAASSWQIEYGTTGFSQGSGTTVTASSNPYTLTGLTSNTTYDWYVRANCSLNGWSNWVGPSTFTTLCAAISSFPYTYGFEDQTTGDNSSCPSDGTVDLISCWRNVSGEGSDWKPLSGSTASSNTGPSAAQEGSNYIYCETSSSCGPVFDLYAPEFDFTSLTTPYITFYYHMYGSDVGTLQLLGSTDNWATMDTLWEKSGDQGNAWVEAKVTTSYGGETSAQFIWRYFGASGYTGDVAIDNVTVQEAPTCLEPTDQTETNITNTSVDLAWTQSGTAISWDIELGPTGFTPTGTPTQTGVTNPYTYTGLSGNTTYDWYVRAKCDSTTYSNWTGPSTFTTLLDYDLDTSIDFLEKPTFGSPVKFDITIQNTGGNTDNYDLSVSNNNWTTQWVDGSENPITNTGDLTSGTSIHCYVKVTPPSTRDTTDTAKIFITSHNQSTIVDSFIITTSLYASSGGPDSTGYSWKNKYATGGPTYDWINLTSKTEITGLGDDAYAGPFDIGFNFSFYGHTYTQFFVGSNGLITFGSGSTSYSNTTIPNTNNPDTLIAWFWDDLDPGDNPDGDTHVYYAKTLVGSDSCLVISFLNYHEYPGGNAGKLTAQVILYPNGNIKLQYQSFDGGIDMASATVGIENEGGTDGLQYEYNQNKLENEMAIMFYAPSTTLPAPTNLSISMSGNDAVLTWDAVTGANSYIIYRDTNPYGSYTQIGTTANTTYTDTNAGSADKYFYIIKASDAAPALTVPGKHKVVIEHYKK